MFNLGMVPGKDVMLKPLRSLLSTFNPNCGSNLNGSNRNYELTVMSNQNPTSTAVRRINWSMVVNQKIIMASNDCSSSTSVAGGMMLVSPPTVAMSLKPGTV